MVKTLSAIQVMMGVCNLAAGMTGLVLWTRVHLVYVPAVWTGVLFFISGLLGFRASSEKTKGTAEVGVATAVTMISIPAAVASLTQALINFGAYASQLSFIDLGFLENDYLAERGPDVVVPVVDLTIVCATLIQVLTAAMTSHRLHRLIQTREQEHKMRLFFQNPASLAPESYGNTWGYPGPAYSDVDATPYSPASSAPYTSGFPYQQYGSYHEYQHPRITEAPNQKRAKRHMFK